MKSEKKSQLAVDEFLKQRRFDSFRTAMRGQLGMPRTRSADKRRRDNIQYSPMIRKLSPKPKLLNLLEIKHVPLLKMSENSIEKRR